MGGTGEVRAQVTHFPKRYQEPLLEFTTLFPACRFFLAALHGVCRGPKIVDHRPTQQNRQFLPRCASLQHTTRETGQSWGTITIGLSLKSCGKGLSSARNKACARTEKVAKLCRVPALSNVSYMAGL
jgi:hypothetical protein